MNGYKRVIAVLIVVSLIPCWDLVRTVQAASHADSKQAPSTYRSSGSPNPDEVHRVVERLGVGHHVAVKLTGGTVRGHIREIAADHFVLLFDRGAGSHDIAYSDVRELGPNPSKTATMIIVGVVIAAAVIVLAVAVNSAAGKLGL